MRNSASEQPNATELVTANVH